jgi:hypothetical protein
LYIIHNLNPSNLPNFAYPAAVVRRGQHNAPPGGSSIKHTCTTDCPLLEASNVLNKSPLGFALLGIRIGIPGIDEMLCHSIPDIGDFC